MLVSQTPIAWDYALATHAGTYSASDDTDRARLDELIADYRQDRPAAESCPELLKATADQALVTDDNMETEWRYFLHMSDERRCCS
jgi:spermidine synthase